MDGNNRVPVATKTLQYRKDPGRYDQAVWMGKVRAIFSIIYRRLRFDEI